MSLVLHLFFRQGHFAAFLQRLGSHRPCVQAFHAHHARVIAQALVQLAVAHVHANDLGGTVLQQTVGEAAGALPHIEAAQAF